MATRFPVAREASSGSTDSATEITVSRGLYQNISTSAPAHIRELSMITKMLARYPVSMELASLDNAEMYTALFSPEKAEIPFLHIRANTYSLY